MFLLRRFPRRLSISLNSTIDFACFQRAQVARTSAIEQQKTVTNIQRLETDRALQNASNFVTLQFVQTANFTFNFHYHRTRPPRHFQAMQATDASPNSQRTLGHHVRLSESLPKTKICRFLQGLMGVYNHHWPYRKRNTECSAFQTLELHRQLLIAQS